MKAKNLKNQLNSTYFG